MALARLVVLFEDRDMLVVDKPAGVHTAPLHAGDQGTLLGMVIEAYPEVAGLQGRKAAEPGLVNRLDRETSGCVVVARTAAAFSALLEIFAADGASKRYTAACAEPDHAAEGTLSVESRFAPYGPGRRMVRVILPEEKSKRLAQAATRETYRTEARILATGSGRTLLSACITKGFRHQVRAHLSFIGYPIFGDPLYGVAVPPTFPARMYLHAARIEMPHPVSGAAMVVESPEPPEFKALFAVR
jgi:23S rRNA pseudouridine1911/1915/1917 synthase